MHIRIKSSQIRYLIGNYDKEQLRIFLVECLEIISGHEVGEMESWETNIQISVEKKYSR